MRPLHFLLIKLIRLCIYLQHNNTLVYKLKITYINIEFLRHFINRQILPSLFGPSTGPKVDPDTFMTREPSSDFSGHSLFFSLRKTKVEYPGQTRHMIPE